MRVGIDGGKSGLRLRVAGEATTLETKGVTHGRRDLTTAYEAALLELWQGGVRQVERVVAGLSAMPADEAGVGELAEAIGRSVGCREVWLCDDTVTAHRAAFGGGPGAVLAVGTGVGCLVVVADGRGPRRLDGAGPLVGDDGGAFRLGSRALAAAVRMRDGRGPSTTLLHAACMTYATTPQALPEAIHDTEDSVARIADFARVVLGQRDDPVSVAIVVDAARELAATVVAGIRWAATDIEVAVTGGLADELTDEGSVLGAAFAAELRAADVDPTRLRLAPPPVEGACALATDDDPGAYATLVSRHEVRVPRASGATAGSYLRGVVELLEEVRSSESGAIVRAAHAFADAIASGGMVHTFGTGHSHLLAEELFYRAGGLARIDPILDEGLMLHVSAVASTWHERRSDLAERVASRHDIRPGDVVVVASNSGGNRVTTDMARLARNRGSVVVAVTSVAHATSDQARHSDDQRLHELADIVLDNHGTPGDAAVRVPGLAEPVAPTSTVVGAALLQAVVAEAVAILVGRGIDPEVFRSANTAGGDAANSALIARYSPRVAAL